jgi:hypothetical protein
VVSKKQQKRLQDEERRKKEEQVTQVKACFSLSLLISTVAHSMLANGTGFCILLKSSMKFTKVSSYSQLLTVKSELRNF